MSLFWSDYFNSEAGNTDEILGTFRKIAKSDYWLRHICPFVRMGKYGFHGSDFYGL
jgi:hypothetical protein